MRNIRCWFGHDWKRALARSGPWVCGRCPQHSEKCDNCGRFHDPRNIVVCIVNR